MSGLRKKPVCPECRSSEVLPVVDGSPTIEMLRAVKQGRAVMANCADWEGQPEWHCEECGCEWRGEWRRFKKPG